jgi:outer membrane protein assembly factor BamB
MTMNVSLRVLISCLALSLIVGCGSNKRKELKPLELESFKSEAKVKTKWSRSIGDGPGKYFHQFVIAQDRRAIYAASTDGKVYKLGKEKGRKRWKVSLDVPVTAGVSVDDKHVYLGLADGALLALNKETGEQVWSFQLGSEMVSAAAVDAGNVVLQASNGEVYNIDAATGEQRWRYDTNMPALTVRGTSRPVFFASFVAIGTANGKILLLDVATGQLRGDPKVATVEGDSELERVVDIDATPAFDNDKLYAISYQGQLMALDLKNGRPLWAQKESSYRDVALGFNNVYVVSDNSTVLAYDQRTGDLKWVQERLLRRKLSAPAPFSSFLLVADFEGYLHVLSQIDGHFVARKKVDSSGVRANILVDGERFYALANDGRLKAYELKLKD